MGERSAGEKGLSVEQRTFLMADLGPVNPLPMLGAPLGTPYKIGSGLPPEIRDGAEYGVPANLYPYQAQDGYDRVLSERSMSTVVLENDNLRAVFLPELGGRLWELFDKSSEKHLIHTQSQIQFANLALRNAWFAGGIEWNIGTRGHSAITCSPLHTSFVHTPDGQEILRMWEFDRLRKVIFQIDVRLPDESAVLLISIRIRNPNDHEVPMYWWTNAAIPEAAGSRIIVPASTAFASNYTDIVKVTPTDHRGVDCTWPTHNKHAADYFFDLEPNKHKWIVNADENGDGLAMISTETLRGRKLFVWGQGDGGQRWQRWLNPEGHRYAEIQAGLAQTQLQHLPMPPRTEWSWTEAYGNPKVDTRTVHGSNWNAAIEHSESRISALISRAALDEAHGAALAYMDLPPQRSVVVGSGWGALEADLRRRSGKTWFPNTGTPFSAATITRDQQPWLDLLNGAGFNGAETFVSGQDWQSFLEAADTGPHSLLHRALITHGEGDLKTARRLYLASLRLQETALAHRGLAIMAVSDGDSAAARSHYRSACLLEPGNGSLLIEAAGGCIAGGGPEEALRLLEDPPVRSGQLGRVRFLRAVAYARSGRRPEAAAVLQEGLEIADFREGDSSLMDLWRDLFPGEELPREYEFSMT